MGTIQKIIPEMRNTIFELCVPFDKYLIPHFIFQKSKNTFLYSSNPIIVFLPEKYRFRAVLCFPEFQKYKYPL